VFALAAAHKGTSFVEVYQNCVIFNPNEWGPLEDRRERDDHMIYLEHGQPIVFGKNRDRGIRLNGFRPEVVQLGNGVTEDDLIVHDKRSKQLAYTLSSIEYPDFPAFMGVLYEEEKPTYTDGLMEQIESAQAAKGKGDLNALYRSTDVWTVTEQDVVDIRVEGHVSSELDDEYVDDIDKAEVTTTAVQDQLTETTIADLKPHIPIVADAGTSLAKAIRQMNAHGIGCLPVTDDDDRLVGIFTERDVTMRVAGQVTDLKEAHLADYMTPDPITITGDLPLAQALHLMSVHGFRHLPLVDEEHRPIGIISFRDVVHYLKESLT
jgi:CBS domain-containing protein